MAKTSEKDQIKVDKRYEFEYKTDYREDWDIHRNYVNTFDPLEAMMMGEVWDSVSNASQSSKITDSYTATLAIERAARVMGKLPEGETVSAARKDMGKAMFMDIIRQKWYYVNANAQHPFELKLQMWQLYSSVYGYMPMFYDWNVSHTGYIGPDCWLWNPRNLIPQQGRSSIADMDYVTALTWVDSEYLQNILDENSDENEGQDEEDGWDRDALKVLIEIADKHSTEIDTDKDTVGYRSRTNQAVRKGICLATRYEAGEDGRWITFAPDHGYCRVRNIKNPHKNGRIPFVIKYSQPTYDSFYGIGDFQRAKPLQAARDGLTNFYFDGIKMNLIPPIIVNSNGVLKHTIDYRPGGVMMETIPNSIRQFQTSNAGLSTYQAAMSSMTGQLLSQFGSQNAAASASETLNPSQGKTPQAIDLYNDKEATRDGQERKQLESGIEQLIDGFNSLVVNIGTEKIDINLFAEDVEEIRKVFPNVMEMFKGEYKEDESLGGADLKIDPEKLRNVEMRFNIASGSTAKLNKEKQLQSLRDEMEMLGKFQNIIKEDQRVQVNWDKITEAYNRLSDIPGSDAFITMQDAASPREQQMEAQLQQATQQIEQMQQQMQQYDKLLEERLEKQRADEAEGRVSELEAQMQEQEKNAPVVAGGNAFNDPEIGNLAKEFEGGIDE